MKEGKAERKTKEVEVKVSLKPNGEGKNLINIPIPFLKHMLELLSFHSGIDLNIEAKGDIDVDLHHTVEDVGLAIGEALSKAIGDGKDISRYGSAIVPMDEALTLVSVDVSGRGLLVYKVKTKGKIGNFDMELIETFFNALASKGGVTLHIILQYGKNKHHIAEAIFKGFAVALRNALSQRKTGIPSTKGTL